MKPLTFGYRSIVSDFIYLWSIQYYGDPAFRPLRQFLPKTYDLITELDPNFLDAYGTGALFLFYEGRNPKAALKLLDKGLEKNPAEWILPMDAGFYCLYNLRNKDLSASYFQKAARVPGAPTFPKRMLAGVEFKKGDKRAALRLWTEVYKEAERASVKQTAFQHVHDLKVLIDLEELRKGIEFFRKANGRAPYNLAQLSSAGFMTEIPKDPEENYYDYDPRTGTVKYSKELKMYNRFQ
jgi:tetratricopeptide (TPR) repeat protein